jgi:hypothetical protein
MKDQLIILVEAVRAAQAVLSEQPQRSAMDIEILRGLLCNVRVTRAMRALSFEDSPSTAPERAIPFEGHVAAS